MKLKSIIIKSISLTKILKGQTYKQKQRDDTISVYDVFQNLSADFSLKSKITNFTGVKFN